MCGKHVLYFSAGLFHWVIFLSCVLKQIYNNLARLLLFKHLAVVILCQSWFYARTNQKSLVRIEHCFVCHLASLLPGCRRLSATRRRRPSACSRPWRSSWRRQRLDGMKRGDACLTALIRPLRSVSGIWETSQLTFSFTHHNKSAFSFSKNNNIIVGVAKFDSFPHHMEHHKCIKVKVLCDLAALSVCCVHQP